MKKEVERGAFPHVRHAARSDVGRRRKNNEDSYGAFPAAGIFCVADGMGGGDDGEVASAATVRAVGAFAERHLPPKNLAYPAADVLAGVRACLNGASAWILERATSKRLKGCGSTFAGVVLDPARPDMATALHAGDSRVYQIRGRSIQQITKDHSAAELIGAKDESEVNPMFRGMILRAVGIQPSVELEATPLSVREGDKLLICSDGLYRMVPDKRVLSIVRANDTPASAVEALVDAANEAGGVDNVTVVLLEIGKLPSALPVVKMPEESRSGAENPPTGAKEAETQDTSGDSGVSFEAAASGDSASRDTRDGEGEPTRATVTIPEAAESDDADDALSCGGDGKAVAAADRKPARGIRRKSVVLSVLLLGVVGFCCTVGILQRNKAAVQASAEARRQEEVLLAAEKARKLADEQARAAEQARIAEQARLAREQAEKEAAERLRIRTEALDDRLVAFERVCEVKVASAFVDKVFGLLGKDMPKSIYRRFRPLMRGSTETHAEKLAAAVELTRDVQVIVSRLADRVADKSLKEAEPEFTGAAREFMDEDPAEPNAQAKCVSIIESVPKWF